MRALGADRVLGHLRLAERLDDEARGRECRDVRLERPVLADDLEPSAVSLDVVGVVRLVEVGAFDHEPRIAVLPLEPAGRVERVDDREAEVPAGL
jgi:hypothetical protein